MHAAALAVRAILAAAPRQASREGAATLIVSARSLMCQQGWHGWCFAPTSCGARSNFGATDGDDAVFEPACLSAEG
jgi:hypothetical protein